MIKKNWDRDVTRYSYTGVHGSSSGQRWSNPGAHPKRLNREDTLHTHMVGYCLVSERKTFLSLPQHEWNLEFVKWDKAGEKDSNYKVCVILTIADYQIHRDIKLESSYWGYGKGGLLPNVCSRQSISCWLLPNVCSRQSRASVGKTRSLAPRSISPSQNPSW